MVANPVGVTVARDGHLLRVLGLAFGVAVGVGSIIGGGILRTPGSVLNHVPNIAVVLFLWALGAVHSLLGANVVSEVMTAVPRSGGLFVVARRAFGNFGGLLVGWSDWLLNVATIAALSIASAEFLAIIFPVMNVRPVSTALVIAVGFLLLNWLGVREGSTAQIVTSAAKGVLLLILVAAIYLLSPQHQEVQTVSLREPLTLFGLVVGFQLILGVYSGWACPACFAEENRDPAKNIPRALLLSVLIVGAIYLLINAALIFAVPISDLRASRLPLAVAVSGIFGPTSTKVVAAVAFMTTISCLNATIMVTLRILQGLARDGLFPHIAAHVNRGGTPDIALAISAAFAIVLTLTGEFQTVFLVVGALAILNNAVTDAALFKLRISEPDLPRPFRAIGYPWLPAFILFVDVSLVALFLMSNIRSTAFMVGGLMLIVPISIWMRRPERKVA